MLNRITNVVLQCEFRSPKQEYHLNNVQCLAISDLDDRLLTLITQNVNCSRIQHLYLSSAIRTKDLQYIPLLQTYLPHLHSLTFYSVPMNSVNWLGDYEGNLFDFSIRRSTRFLFRRNGDWITIWIEQAAY